MQKTRCMFICMFVYFVGLLDCGLVILLKIIQFVSVAINTSLACRLTYVQKIFFYSTSVIFCRNLWRFNAAVQIPCQPPCNTPAFPQFHKHTRTHKLMHLPEVKQFAQRTFIVTAVLLPPHMLRLWKLMKFFWFFESHVHFSYSHSRNSITFSSILILNLTRKPGLQITFAWNPFACAFLFWAHVLRLSQDTSIAYHYRLQY